MDRPKVINMGQHGLHALGAGFKSVKPEQWIEPDEASYRHVKPFHFMAQAGSCIPVQPVGHEKANRALVQDAARPVPIELTQGLTNTCAPRPVLDGIGHCCKGDIDILLLKVARNVRQPCAEHKTEHTVAIIGYGMEEVEEQS